MADKQVCILPILHLLCFVATKPASLESSPIWERAKGSARAHDVPHQYVTRA